MAKWVLQVAILVAAAAGSVLFARADPDVPHRASPRLVHIADASATAVPWIDAVPAGPTPAPPASPNPAPAGARPCLAPALDIAFTGAQGATGEQVVIGFALANHSATTCTLSGHPQLALVTAAGRFVAVTAPAAVGREQVTLLAHHGLLHVPAAMQVGIPGQAGFAVISGNEREACMQSRPWLGRLGLALPAHGGVLTLQAPIGIRVCPGSPLVWPFGADDITSIGNIVLAAIPSPAPPRYDVRVLTPAPLPAGRAIRYDVLLTNRGKMPLLFASPCPSYGEALDPSETGLPGPAVYVLNCHGLAPVWPGKRVTFSMVLPATDAAGGSGRHVLYWQLLWFPSDGLGGTARAIVQIR